MFVYLHLTDVSCLAHQDFALRHQLEPPLLQLTTSFLQQTWQTAHTVNQWGMLMKYGTGSQASGNGKAIINHVSFKMFSLISETVYHSFRIRWDWEHLHICFGWQINVLQQLLVQLHLLYSHAQAGSSQPSSRPSPHTEKPSPLLTWLFALDVDTKRGKIKHKEQGL